MQKLPHEPIKITNEPVLRKRVSRQIDKQTDRQTEVI